MTKKKKYTILMSGGHLTPALAVIDQAKKEKRACDFVFLGRLYSQEDNKQKAHEKEEVEKRDVPFIPTIAPKFHKTYWWRNFLELHKWMPALSKAYKVIQKYKPDVFLSFGGYLAFPIALVCKLKHIPIVTHEQTVSVGLANKMIALLSTKVAVSHETTLQLVSKQKAVLTGNPIRPSLLYRKVKKPKWISSDKKPILYITGGNQGSEVINNIILQTLNFLTKNYYVIHQCGRPTKLTDYKSLLKNVAEQLPASQQKYYTVTEWLNEQELAWIFNNAKLVISRSGANTMQEIVVHTIPSILIPLPFSHNNEQLKNAQKLADPGAAIVLEQNNLTPEVFIDTVTQALQRSRVLKRNLQKIKEFTILDGSQRLLNLVESIV